MLNRENKAVLKCLKGKYKKFAKRLSSAAFARCEGRQAINENLEEMFAMLQNAQEQGKPFEAAIPDADTTIRETLLCFPPKNIWRLALIWVCSALFVISAAVGGGVLYKKLTNQGPRYFLGEIEEVAYDKQNDMIFWSGLENVNHYVLFAVDPVTDRKVELGQTSRPYLRLYGDQRDYIRSCFEKKRDRWLESIDIKIVAKAESEVFFDYETQLPMRFCSEMQDIRMDENIVISDIPYARGWQKFVSVEFVPQESDRVAPYGAMRLLPFGYNFYGRIVNSSVAYIFEVSEQDNGEKWYLRLDPLTEQFFRGDCQYIFILRTANERCKLQISIPDIWTYQDQGEIPAGDTIFAVPNEDTPIAGTCQSPSIALSYLGYQKDGAILRKEEETRNTIFSKPLSPLVRSWGADRLFHVAHKQTDQAEWLRITDNLIEFDTEDFAETITFEPGYTTIHLKPLEEANAEAEGMCTYFFSILSKKNVECYTADAYSSPYNKEYKSISPLEGLNGGILHEWDYMRKTSDHFVTLYVEEETNVTVEGQLWGQLLTSTDKTVHLKDTLRLKPGYTQVALEYDNLFVSSDSKFEISGSCPWVYPWKIEEVSGTLIYNGWGFRFKFFNPYDYEIEIKAEKVDIILDSN